jgi:hypothetical protein
MTIFYHRTTEAGARIILREGFRDAIGNYLTGEKHKGVWLSNIPLDCNEGAKGDVLLRVEMPMRGLKKFEWIEDGKPYREWLVPAELINKQAKVSVEVEDGDA